MTGLTELPSSQVADVAVAGLANKPAATLLQIEERLQTLFDSEEFIDPAAANADELRTQLQAEIAEALQAELTKVDGIANYLAWLENQVGFAVQEIDRLKARKERFERRQERLEAMVMALMKTHQKPRLEGHTTFLALRANPASLEIVNDEEIPIEYKIGVVTSEWQIDKNKIKRVLKANIAVPGVRLITDKQRLVRG